jgi:hypothetical protein
MTQAGDACTNRSNTSLKTILVALPEVFHNSKGRNEYQFTIQHGIPPSKGCLSRLTQARKSGPIYDRRSTAPKTAFHSAKGELALVSGWKA